MRDETGAGVGRSDNPFQLDGCTPFLHKSGCCDDYDRLWELAGAHLGLFGWLRVVNWRCHAIDRIGMLDLPRRDWRAEYEGRVPPDEAADVALDEFASVHGMPQR